ncbi:pentatricopeptide repeat-containing protein At1g05670, mitochondrial-like [Humulus lupulus]|uniref:pentatricopeptide repeat-containing protein At1g05670, mitochondrial-like n=1 Tax=Humulus lupulus TaxID=3486 RepID=UPI002B402E9C|nr:pentatricopeptide repeat-containing protein At1g05670, mitochondrial-like [Humulus lupulus]
MATMIRKGLTNPSQALPDQAIVTSITTLLHTLNPKKANPSELNKFSQSLNPSLVTRVIKNQTDPDRALFFFNWASNPIPNPNNYSHTHLCYVAITDLLLSHSLFSTASSLLLQYNRLSDFMVGRLIKAHGDRGDIRGAIDWVYRAKMIENGRCLYSYNAILGVLVRACRIGLAKAFYDQIVREDVVKPDVYTYTTMIRGFCKMGMIEGAQKVFDEMICGPNLMTYNILIDGFCKKGDMEGARRVLRLMMESKHCLPDTVTYTTLVDGFCRRGEMEEAMECLKEMEEHGCELNVATYNALIHGFCLVGEVDEGKRMIARMRLNGVKDDVATHTAVLKGLCIAGKPDEGVEYLKEMAVCGMNLDLKAYGVIVNQYCKEKKPDKAISLLQEMKTKGLNPSVSSFNSVLNVLVENGDLDRAVLLLNQIPLMGCHPNYLSCDMVIRSLSRIRGRMKEVEELVGSMIRDGHKIGSALYGCLIKGYSEEGNVDMAVKIFYEMVEENYIISLENFSAVIKVLCAVKKVNEAEIMFNDMSRRCKMVDVNSYRRVLDELIRQ